MTAPRSHGAMAHLPAPEPRWRWLLGVAGELAFLVSLVVLVALIASVQA